MITYDKGWGGNRVLFRVYGSAFPRAMPYACLSAAIAATVSALFDTTEWQLFRNSYPLQLFFFIVGFMVIFRNNLSYGRYWEGRTQLQTMTAKISDAVRVTLNFDRAGMEGPDDEEHKWFCDTFVHLVSLFHGVALATLRGDFDMENLAAHDSCARAPPDNARSIFWPADGQTGKLVTGASEPPPAQHTPQQARGHTPENSKDEARVPLDSGSDGGGAAEEAPTWTKSSPFSRAWAGRKGLLDIFVLRTSPQHAQHIHSTMKLPVIGGFTQAEGVALGAFTTSGGTSSPDLDLGIHGVMLSDGTYAPAPTERVQVIASWIHQCLIERINAGGVKASSSLQSRIYHSLADAFVAFEQCQKLTDTPFPFPWVQAVNISLAIFTLFAPLAVVSFIENIAVCTVLTFLAVATHATLNEVASDIEDPFHYDPNQLPLPQMQYKLNERLLAVLHSDRPIAFTDVGDLTGPGNTISVRGVSPAASSPPPPVADQDLDAGSSGAETATASGAVPHHAAGAGDRFASVALAAFADAAAAKPMSPDGAPAQPTLLTRSRSAASRRRWQQHATDVREFKTSHTAPASAPSARWRTSAATASGAAASALSRGSRGSIRSHRGMSPRVALGSGSPAASMGGDSGASVMHLTMPPSPIAMAMSSGAEDPGVHARQVAPGGWRAVRSTLQAVEPERGSAARPLTPLVPSAAAQPASGPEAHSIGGHTPGSQLVDSRGGTRVKRESPRDGSDPEAGGPGSQGSPVERMSSAVHAVVHAWRKGRTARSTQHGAEGAGVSAAARPQHAAAEESRKTAGGSSGLHAESLGTEGHSTQHAVRFAAPPVTPAPLNWDSIASLSRIPTSTQAGVNTEPRVAQRGPQHVLRAVRTDGHGPPHASSTAPFHPSDAPTPSDAVSVPAREQPAAHPPHSTQHARHVYISSQQRTLPWLPRRSGEWGTGSSSSSSLDSS